ncbi:putative metal-binding motif-containing protein [Myxococcota bacterium]|nr:putative metal-binding motif-containing protein [Myxococcota bacterium]
MFAHPLLRSSGLSRVAGVLTFSCLAACAGPTADDPLDPDTRLYALSQSIGGVHLYPPLGPAPAATATFDARLRDGLSVVLEATGADGATNVVATYDAQSSPAVSLYGDHEMYGVVIAAAGVITDPSQSYSFRVLHGGVELARSDLDARIFDVMATRPAFQIGVKLRIDTDAGLEPIPPRATRRGGSTCPTKVDGRCCVPSPEVCDGADNDCDGVADDGNPGGGEACDSGVAGVCSVGATSCESGALVCVQTVFPSTDVCNQQDDDCDGTVDEGATEVCDGVDNDCDGSVDEGVCPTYPATYASCGGWTGRPTVCTAGWNPMAGCEATRLARNIAIASHNNPITATTSALDNGYCYGVGPNYSSPVLFGGWWYQLSCLEGGTLSGSTCRR